MTRICLLAAVLCCLFFAACAGKAPQASLNEHATPPAGSTQSGIAGLFPPPSELIGLVSSMRGVSYAETDLVKAGEEYSQPLPNNRAAAGTGAELTPDWSEGAPLDGLAYCMYHFSVPGYDRNPQVRLAWNQALSNTSDFWIGVGNWPGDRWEWHEGNPDNLVNFHSMDNYLSGAGDVLVCIVSTGSTACNLAQVRIGTVAPQPAIEAPVNTGFVPFTCEFDATASFDPDGEIVLFEWDFDGNGTFESKTGTVGSASHVYNIPGPYNPVVRITDNDGVCAQCSVGVNAINEFTHTYGATSQDAMEDMAVDSSGCIYQVGHTDFENSALIVKFDQLGTPVWARTFDGPGQEVFKGVGVDDAGLVYVCGKTTSFSDGNEEALLQCWTPNGTLSWSKIWRGLDDENASGFDRFNDLTMSSNNIFVAGQTESYGDQDAIVARFNLDGSLVWARHFGETIGDCVNAIETSQLMGEDPKLHIVGYSVIDIAPTVNILYCVITEDGSFETGTYYGGSGFFTGFSVSPPDANGGTLLISGCLVKSGPDELYIIAPEKSWVKRWTYQYTSITYDIQHLSDGNYMFASHHIDESGAFHELSLLTLTAMGEVVDAQVRDYQGPGDGKVRLCPYNDGIAVGGSALDTTGGYSAITPTLTNYPFTFQSASVSLGLLNANNELLEANGTVANYTGVLDTGGGDADFLIDVRQIESD